MAEDVQNNDLAAKKERLFGEIVEDDDARPTEIESLCMSCGENGVTKLLLTRIPHWRDIAVMGFECEHCGLSNNEVQFAGSYAKKGCKYTCEIHNKDDINRQIVRSETASIRIQEIELEMPASKKRGILTTVEGLVSNIVDDLSADQPVRKHMDEVTYRKLEATILKLRKFLENGEPFTISVDDPAGNSYIENLCAPNPDPKLMISHYERSHEMNVALGITTSDAVEPNGADSADVAIAASSSGDGSANVNADDAESGDVPEVITFPGNCSSCNVPCETRMHITNIPYFKEVVIMSTTCDACGYKSNEIKAGGPISSQGKLITLKLEDVEDMSRDVLKSETCGLVVPEIDLELLPGTLGGRFTTIEGLLRQIRDDIEERIPFASGDSVQEERKATFRAFMDKLQKLIDGEVMPFHLILDDPLANSYLQNLYAPDSDPCLTIKHYDRTWEQNETLGLNDINVDDYGNADEKEDSMKNDTKSE